MGDHLLARRVRHALAVSSVVLAASMLHACGDRPRAGADASTSATAVDSASGRRQEGDEQAEWRALRRGDTVRVSETAHFGTDGVAERTFVFTSAGALVRADEVRTQTVLSGDRSPEPLRSRLTATFTDPPTSSKVVGGVARDALPYEIDNLRRTADALFTLANGALTRAPTP